MVFIWGIILIVLTFFCFVTNTDDFKEFLMGIGVFIAYVSIPFVLLNFVNYETVKTQTEIYSISEKEPFTIGVQIGTGSFIYQTRKEGIVNTETVTPNNIIYTENNNATLYAEQQIATNLRWFFVDNADKRPQKTLTIPKNTKFVPMKYDGK